MGVNLKPLNFASIRENMSLRTGLGREGMDVVKGTADCGLVEGGVGKRSL